MKVVTIACPKGGSTKTTTVSALAVRASQDKARVAMIDLNVDQGNLTQWWILRGEPKNPRLISDVDNLVRDVEILRAKKFDWLFIDTPPLDMDMIELAVVVADAVVVPIRTSIFDLGTIEPIVEMCTEHRKPFAFLLSAVDNRFKTLTAKTMVTLAPDGPILDAQISYRSPYINALTVGKTGPEINKELVAEIDAVWSEVQRLASSQPAVKVRAANDR